MTARRGAHTQKASDRQNHVRLLAVACHQQVVNLADRFVRIVGDAIFGGVP
jgi:hypothetical protein